MRKFAALCAAVMSAGGFVPLAAALPDTSPRLDAYAAGRLAEGDSKPVQSVSAFRLALDSDPASGTIARRSYRQALIAGDMPLALRSLRVLEKQDAMPSDGLLLLLVDAFARRDFAGARKVADAMASAEQLAFVAPFARSWASVGDGPYDPPVIATGDAFAAYALRHVDEQLMLQRLSMGDGKGAREAFTVAASKRTSFPAALRLSLAQNFAALAQTDYALALLSGDTSTAGTELRKRIEGGQKVTAPGITPLTGIAVLIDRLAQDLSAGGNAAPVLSLLRMAIFADPASIPIRLDVARGLLASGYAEMAFEEAGKVPYASPAWADAQALRVAALSRQGRDADAVTYARGLSLRSGAGEREYRLLGEALLQGGHAGEAAQAFAQALAQKDGGDEAKLLLQKGSALELAGQWTQAKDAMERALALAPDNPAILNHLGYSLADRKEDLPRAIAMLQKANTLAPDEPAYMDSLGWAYYRAGQPERALPLLEKAVAAAPGEAEINEHLGDVLWAVGRQFEARYAWNAALVSAQGEVKDRIARKVDFGLPEAAVR